MTTDETYRQYAIEEYTIDQEPYYVPIKDEIELFEAAYAQKIPVLLKGPTGCGKTRFIEHMAFKLGRPLTVIKETDVFIACLLALCCGLRISEVCSLKKLDVDLNLKGIKTWFY